jgi:hypothetical protein
MKKVISLFASLSLVLFITACSLTTANIDDVKVCTSITDNQCLADNSLFTTNTPEIYISCHLNNAPENTEVEFAWFYLGQEKMAIDAVKLSSGSNIGTLNLQSSLSKPTNGWPQGDYEVVLSIVGFDIDPIVKKFSVQ